MKFVRVLVVCLLTAPWLPAQQPLASIPPFQNAVVKSLDATAGVAAAMATVGDSESQWFAWEVPIRGRSICCWQGQRGCCGSCTLDGGNGFSINDREEDDGGPNTIGAMMVVVRVEAGRIRKVRIFSASCPIDGQGKTVHLLPGISTDQSIDFLLAQIRNADREGELMAALSLHDSPRVVTALIELARRDPDRETRRHAIFWLGQKAGAQAASELRRAVDEDLDDEVRQHAVFAISQLPTDRGVPILIELVKTHKSRKVREKAMFWLAQTGDPRALDLIEEILLR